MTTSRAPDDFEHTDWSWLRSKRGAKWVRPGSDVIPAWVAEMDFPVCSIVRDAIVATIDRGDLGYPAWDANPLAEAFERRMAIRYGWGADAGDVRGATDLIQGVQRLLHLVTAPGDAITTVVPNYPPFLRIIPSIGRRLSTFPLEHTGEGWSFDASALSDELDAANSRVLLFVNPHNPTGHVFRRDELESIAAVACEKDLTVISDEIHADLTYDPHAHIPLAAINDDVAARTITLTSATKSFNIAGLRCAVVHIGPPRIRAQWDAQPSELYGTMNVLGVEATLAAWEHGDDWLMALRHHLEAQRAYLGQRLASMPGVTWSPPDATYLAWLDCRAAELPGDPAAFFRSAARVELVSGPDFGPGGTGFARLNFATSRAVLARILDALEQALNRH